MKIQIINNYKYRAVSWNKFFYFSYNQKPLTHHHILFGLFNIFLFITWRFGTKGWQNDSFEARAVKGF